MAPPFFQLWCIVLGPSLALPRMAVCILQALWVSPRSSAKIDSIPMPKTKCNHQAALLSIEKVLTLLRSVQTLEGTDKDGVEHLLEMAVENLKQGAE